jgi:hypothetical protein
MESYYVSDFTRIQYELKRLNSLTGRNVSICDKIFKNCLVFGSDMRVLVGPSIANLNRLF